MCISDIPIYIVAHSACLCGSDEMFCLMDFYTQSKFCCHVYLPLLFLRKLQCWRLYFHDLALPLSVFLKDKNEDEDTFISRKKKLKATACHVLTCGSGCEADKGKVFWCRRL